MKYSRAHRERPSHAAVAAAARRTESTDFERWGWPVFLLSFAGIAVLFFMANKNPPPPELGVKNGLLSPCTEGRANSVSSQILASDLRVSPLTMPGDLNEARRIIGEAVLRMPRTKLIGEADNYLRYECTSLAMRFVDDLELYFNEHEKLVHIRSGSRCGFWDFGANRRRVEQLRSMLPLGFQGPGTQALPSTEPVSENDSAKN